MAPPAPPRLRPVMLAVGVAVAAAALVALPARATRGGQTTADEPQYLLSAISLAEDRSLDIGDELADDRWREFRDAAPPVQTEPLPDGREVSPHDPLLPFLLAGPVAVGGWQGAKAALAGLAAALAALLVWVAVRRFEVGLAPAALVVTAFGLAPPLTTYGTQVYPELPAALAVTVAVAAVTGPLDRRGRWLLVVAVVALPWLAVKYVPVAAALTGGALVVLVRRRDDRRHAAALTVVLAAAGAVFLAVHRAVYGGWTVYAAGDHFTSGELSVMGVNPDYGGRSVRLVGLLVDRSFGLAAWAPVFLLAVPAVAALARRRPPGWAAVVVPLAAGWLNATFVALTMHGWWWPGRQVVVVLPCLVLATAWWAGHATAGWVRPALVVTAVAAAGLWWPYLGEVLAGSRTLIIDIDHTVGPLAWAWRAVLPDYTETTPVTWVRHGLWLCALAALAVAGWRTGCERRSPRPETLSTRPIEEHHHVPA